MSRRRAETMSLQQFISEAISPWMKKDGPDSDIVLSSRIRLARNLEEYKFPLLASMKNLMRHQNISVRR